MLNPPIEYCRAKPYEEHAATGQIRVQKIGALSALRSLSSKQNSLSWWIIIHGGREEHTITNRISTMFKTIALLISLFTVTSLSQSAFASDCPAILDNIVEKDRLHAGLLAAQSEMNGRAVGDQLWNIWTTAPDKTS